MCIIILIFSLLSMRRWPWDPSCKISLSWWRIWSKTQHLMPANEGCEATACRVINSNAPANNKIWFLVLKCQGSENTLHRIPTIHISGFLLALPIVPGYPWLLLAAKFSDSQSYDFCKRLFFTFHFTELEVIFFMTMHFIIEYIKPC